MAIKVLKFQIETEKSFGQISQDEGCTKLRKEFAKRGVFVGFHPNWRGNGWLVGHVKAIPGTDLKPTLQDLIEAHDRLEALLH